MKWVVRNLSHGVVVRFVTNAFTHGASALTTKEETMH